MSAERCQNWHEMLAMRALGEITPGDADAVSAHLEGCEECQMIADELAGTVRLLIHVDPASVTPTASVPPALSERVLGGLRDAGAHEHRRALVLTGAVGVLIAALVIGVLVGHAPSSHDQRTFTLTGSR